MAATTTMIDFGARLRQARERKGYSVEQIAKATKIPHATLEALERNDLSKLPRGIFGRSFVRAYAAEVGLDPEETVQEFLTLIDEAAGASTHPAPAPFPTPPHAHTLNVISPEEEVEFESRQKMAGVALKLILLSLPIAIAVIYWNSRTASRTEVERGSASVETAATVWPATPEPERVLPPAPDPSEISGTSSAAGSAPPLPAPGPLVDAAEGVTIEVAPTAECWFELRIDGQVAASRLLAPGDRERHRFTENAVLLVGDAAACATFINGRPMRPLGRQGQVRTVTITRDNYASLIP